MNHLGDTNKMVDTPRTNQVSIRPQYGDEWDWCRADFARQLERELNAANVEIEEKRKDVVWLATEKAKLEERIKRLEEAGDALYANCDPSRWDSTATAARKLSDQNAWHKAKEAKL